VLCWDHTGSEGEIDGLRFVVAARPVYRKFGLPSPLWYRGGQNFGEVAGKTWKEMMVMVSSEVVGKVKAL
jgi:hypothetical protein